MIHQSGKTKVTLGYDLRQGVDNKGINRSQVVIAFNLGIIILKTYNNFGSKRPDCTLLTQRTMKLQHNESHKANTISNRISDKKITKDKNLDCMPYIQKDLSRVFCYFNSVISYCKQIFKPLIDKFLIFL